MGGKEAEGFMEREKPGSLDLMYPAQTCPDLEIADLNLWGINPT